jgi:alkylated DNA nucleotide flippase Atl1
MSGSWLFVVASAVAVVKAISPGASISNGSLAKLYTESRSTRISGQQMSSRFY